MKRREFLQGMVVAIAALVLPKGKAKPAEEYVNVHDIAASAGRQSKTHYLDKDIQLYEQVKMAEAEPEMLFGRPIVARRVGGIGGDIVLGDLSAYYTNELLEDWVIRIPLMAGHTAYRYVNGERITDEEWQRRLDHTKPAFVRLDGDA